ncbi:MAG: hypothetical protein AAB380_07620, partial [Verrucomicrobiota bacterium]
MMKNISNVSPDLNRFVTRMFRPLPTVVLGLLCSAIAADAANRVVAWGDLNYDVTVNSTRRSRVAQIASGSFHSLVLENNWRVTAWGDNRFGQTGAPDQLQQYVVRQVAAGNVHSLALLWTGKVVAWGPAKGQYGDYGQCDVPTDLTRVVAVAAGATHSLAIKRGGTVVAWGGNWAGQCDVPPGLNNVVAIAGGASHSVALKKDGTVVAWGNNAQGQTSVPAGLDQVVAIAALVQAAAPVEMV